MSLFGDWADADDDGGLRRAAADPRRRVRQGRQAAPREGDARPVRVRPPAVRDRGGVAAQGRALDHRRRRARRRRDGPSRRCRHRRWPGSSPSAATRWRCSCSRTSRRRSRSRCSHARSSSTATSSPTTSIVAVKGRLDRRDESRVNLICQSIEVLPGLESSVAPPLRLRIPSTSLDELSIQRLKRMLRDHPGDSVVTLDVGTQVLRLSDEFRVDLDLRRRRAAHGVRPRRRRALIRSPAFGTARRGPVECAFHTVTDRKRGHGSSGANERFGGPHRRRPRRSGVDGWSVRHRGAVQGQGGLGPRHHRPASRASCTGSRSPRSSASAARPACCSG